MGINIKLNIRLFWLAIWIFKKMPYRWVVKAKWILKVMPMDYKNWFSHYVQYETDC
jgi:hypothetical protein